MKRRGDSGVLEITQAHLRAMLDTIPARIALVDREGRHCYVNEAYWTHLGVAPEAVLGRTIREIVGEQTYADMRPDPIHRALFEQALAGEVAQWEGWLAHFEGPRYVNRTYYPYRDADGAVQGVFGYSRDLTDARQAEAEIERQREALYQNEKMAAFGSLLAGVAHELNNPLSVVIGNAMMLGDEAAKAAPGLVERTQRILLAAERCGRIVRSFLAMARQSRTRVQPVSVALMVQAALELLAYGLRTSGILVEVAIPADLPEVPCDADQINQVLSNILVNARQVLEACGQPRRVRITAWADATLVHLAVADNGPGVPADIRQRVFDPFFTTKPSGAGIGIGLAVSRGIVESHGGTLTLEDAQEGGASFVIRLPRHVPGGDAGPALAVIATALQATRQRALVLDDEAEIAALLADMLALQGYDCDIATSGEAALENLRRCDYALLLFDLRLPGLDGPAVFEWLVEHKPHLRARTGFVTGDTLGAAAASFLSRSARPMLQKPFTPADLRRLVAEIRMASGSA